MATTTYGASGISPRTTLYAAADMLEHAMPVMVLEKVAKPVKMPQNKSDTIKFRRPKPFTAKTTPLVEGVTPTATAFEFEDVSATLSQYGDVIIITDKIDDTHEDPVLKEAAIQCGENIGRTREALDYAVVRGGTNVFYQNGSARSDVNTALSLGKIRAVTRALRAQKASMITQIISPSEKYDTRAVQAAYVAIGHTDLEADIRNLAGFLPVAQYGQRQTISDHELGSVENVRFILSPDLEPFADAGGAKGSMKSTSGTSADVYPLMVFGKDAFATVSLRGRESVEPSIIPVSQKTKDDPLAQRGYVGWKTWHAATILNQLWMARLEVAVTAL